MAYVFKDKYGTEFISEEKPTRGRYWWILPKDYQDVVKLPKGTIKHLINFEMSYSDDPQELKEIEQ